MNFRVTTLFFGILLTTLWVFGLMIAYKKTTVDQSLIMSTIQSADVKIDRIHFKRFDQEKKKDLPAVEFVVKDDRWYLQDGKQKTRVEGFRIEEMIRQVKSAKNNETDDVPQDSAATGMKQPQAVVTFKGRLKDDDKEWVVTIGKDSVGTVYVSTSDRPDKVFAVPRMSIDSLLFKDANHLRPKHLFNFTDTAVTSVQMKKAGKTPLELKRDDGKDNTWTFVSPPIGPAEFSDTVEEKKDDPFHGKEATPTRPVSSGVKSLLEFVKNIRVEDDDDFVPLGKSHEEYGVDDKAEMRIDIHSSDKKDDETLLVGNKVLDRKEGEVYYYARLAGDQGVMQINSTWLVPIDKAIDKPGDIRSRNVSGFDPKTVDVVVLKQGEGKDEVEVKFFRPEGEAGWQMYAGGKKYKADTKAMDTLFDQLLGKKAIQEFLDVPDPAELKKKETEWGLDVKGAATVTVYIGGIEKAKKEEDKKDEPKKDDKKDDKAKKDEPKEAVKDKDAPPTLKKDPKAALVLTLGKIDKEFVPVRRTLESGAVSRFTLKKEFAEKVLPATGIVLAYLDSALPTFAFEDVTALQIYRITDKGKETLDLENRDVGGTPGWYLKDPSDPKGSKAADTNAINGITNFFGASLKADKWIKKIEPKEKLDKYGLENPTGIATITVKKQTPFTAASIAGLMVSGFNPVLSATVGAGGFRQLGKTETITITFGKESAEEKEKDRVYAQHSGTEMLFLVNEKLLHEFKTKDVYDRSFMMKEHPQMIAAHMAVCAGNPTSAFMLVSPQVRGVIHDFDPDKVTELRLTVRTPVELRSFSFTRKDKDAPWSSPGLEEFQLDGNKVTELAKDLAKLRTDRFVTYLAGPRMEHKLGPKDANAKIEMKVDGKTVTLTIGTSFESMGKGRPVAHGYFGHSSYWPETVFFVQSAAIDQLLRGGVAHFSKERTGGP